MITTALRQLRTARLVLSSASDLIYDEAWKEDRPVSSKFIPIAMDLLHLEELLESQIEKLETLSRKK